MTLSWWRSSKNRKPRATARRRSRVAGEKLPIRLEVEALECRLVPALHIWTSSVGLGNPNIWSNPNNWIGGAPNELDANIVFNDAFLVAGGSKNSFDDLAQRQIASIEFDSAGYTLGGSGAISLTGPTSGLSAFDVATVGVAAGKDTINMDINLLSEAEGAPPDHQFDASTGSTLVFNDAIHSTNVDEDDQLQLNAVGNTGQIDLGGSTPSDYLGQTVIGDGIVLVQKDTGLGAGDGTAGTGTELLAAGGTPTLELASGVNVANERLLMDSTTSELAALSGASSWGGPVVINTANGGLAGPCTGVAAPAAGTQANFGAIDPNATLTVSGSITEGAGSVANGFSVNLSPTGLDEDGTVVLSGNNTYVGPVNVDDGTLNLQSNNALGGPGAEGVFLENDSLLQFQGGIHIKANMVAGVNVPAIQVDGTGGITRIENVSGNNIFDGDICMFPFGATIGPNNVGIAVDATGDTLTLNGIISDAGSNSSITKTGPGDLALGTTALDVTNPVNGNTYTGGTEVDGGRLVLKKTNAAGFGPIVVLNDAALVTVGSKTAAGFFPFINIPNVITLNTTGAANNGVQLENLSGLSNLDGGVLLDQDTTIRSDAGNLHIGFFSGVGIGVDPAQPPGTTFTVTKTGPGILEYDAVNTYGGTTNVNEGVLNLAALVGGVVGPPGVGAIPFSNGGAEPALTDTPALTVGDGTHNASVVFLNGVNQFADLAQLTVVNPHGTIVVDTGAPAPIGPVWLKGGTINVTDGGALSLSNPNTGIPGPGGVVLSDVTVTADSVIENTDTSDFPVSNIDLNGVTRNFEVRGTSLLTVQPGVTITDLLDLPATGLVKLGTGRMDLQGDASYEGDTVINNGEFDVDGTLDANVVISPTTTNPAILGGTGTVVGTVADNGGALGIVSPAGLGSTGELDTGPVTFASVYQADISDTGNDLLDITGVENLAGATLKINAINLTTGPGTVFTILHASGGLLNAGSASGQFTNAPEGALVAGGLFKVHYTSNDVQLIQQTTASNTALTAVVTSAAGVIPATVKLTATVTVPSGVTIPAGSTVTFLDNGTALAGGTVIVGTNGMAMFTATGITPGVHNFTAQFNPATNVVAASTSNVATITIPKATAAVTLTLVPTVTSAPTGSTVTMTVVVAPTIAGNPTPGGAVVVTGPGGSVTATLVNGTATFQSPPLVTGTNLFTATYSGDSNYVGGATATATVTGIAPPPPAPTSIPNSSIPAGTDLTALGIVTVSASPPAIFRGRHLGEVVLTITNHSSLAVFARLVIHGLNMSKAVSTHQTGFLGGAPYLDITLAGNSTGLLGVFFLPVGKHKLTAADITLTYQVLAGA